MAIQVVGNQCIASNCGGVVGRLCLDGGAEEGVPKVGRDVFETHGGEVGGVAAYLGEVFGFVARGEFVVYDVYAAVGKPHNAVDAGVLVVAGIVDGLFG